MKKLQSVFPMWMIHSASDNWKKEMSNSERRNWIKPQRVRELSKWSEFTIYVDAWQPDKSEESLFGGRTKVLNVA